MEGNPNQVSATTGRRFNNPLANALLGFGQRRPLLGALVQALLVTALFTLLLALRLHGERKVDLPEAAGIFFGVFFVSMLGFNLYSHSKSHKTP